MLSPIERKKISFSLIPSHGTDMKKYDEVYLTFANTGYNKELCEFYAQTFIENVKKPNVIDVLQLAGLYERIHDHKTALYYLNTLQDKKLSGNEKYLYFVQTLKEISLSGNGLEAEIFRTKNINFLQNHSEKMPIQKQADLYIALALTDCACKNYEQALKLLKFGYKPQGKNDPKLLEIFITAVYIFAKYGDAEGLEGALANANSCLGLYKNFDFGWYKEYYANRIKSASKGIF